MFLRSFLHFQKHTNKKLVHFRKYGFCMNETNKKPSTNNDNLNFQMTPKKIVEYLDDYIVGQNEAKKAVAIALRNRWRRKLVSNDIKKEIYPKNILMVGPTGCGKTEIARRLAKMNDAPFIKVEATKYTEIGYHGKDVDDIIKDLTGSAVKQAKSLLTKKIEERKEELEDIILNQLLYAMLGPNISNDILRNDKFQKLKDGAFDDRYVSVEIPYELDSKETCSSIESFFNFLKNYKPNFASGVQKYTMKVRNAKDHLNSIYKDILLNDIDTTKNALQSVQEDGIVFIDEIDKIAQPEDAVHYGKSPSSEGVQRDLLPLIEGTTVNTKYGDVKTDHMLFVASGAFSSSKPTDLFPELLGRLPIRVELKPLTRDDLKKILTEPKYNLITQQKELLKQENISLNFTPEALEEIAAIAEDFNLSMENLGARRLHSLIEKILEDISFEGPDLLDKNVEINAEFVRDKLKLLKDKTDLTRYLI